MTARWRARFRPPELERLSTGLGLLAAGALLVVPLIAEEPSFASGVAVAGVPIAVVFVVGAAILAVAGVADLLGRTELRQGVGVLGLAGLLAAGALLFFSIRAVLEPGGSTELRALVPYAVLAVWASALVVGTVAWGPTQTAVIIGFATIATALLLPIGADGEPFLGYALDSSSSYVLVPAGAAVLVGAWRLLDLPRIGGIVLGGGLAVFTQAWLRGAPATAVPCGAGMADCLQPGDVGVLVWAGCLFVAFGALLGLPSREA